MLIRLGNAHAVLMHLTGMGCRSHCVSTRLNGLLRADAALTSISFIVADPLNIRVTPASKFLISNFNATLRCFLAIQ